MIIGYERNAQKLLGTVDLRADAWGIQKVSLPKSLFHGMWSFDVPQTKWMMYENGAQVYSSTAITSSGGAGKMLTSAAAADIVMESRICPRYQPNRGHLFSTALWCENKTADTVREWGLGIGGTGVCFRLKPDGKLYAVLKSAGVETYEQEIDTTRLNMGNLPFSVECGNVYDIQFQWRGVGNYMFYINLQLVHVFNHLGTLTALSMENPALPVNYRCTRGTEDAAMYLGCADITSENGMQEQLEYGSAYAAAVATSTNTPIIVIKQPLLIGTKPNTRDLTLARISVACSKKAVFKVWSTRDPTALTGGTFVSVNQGSYVECDSPDMKVGAVRVTSVDIAKLRPITSVPVEATVPREVTNPWPYEIVFPIVRGDYLVVTCTAATATSDVVVEWGEHI